MLDLMQIADASAGADQHLQAANLLSTSFDELRLPPRLWTPRNSTSSSAESATECSSFKQRWLPCGFASSLNPSALDFVPTSAENEPQSAGVTSKAKPQRMILSSTGEWGTGPASREPPVPAVCQAQEMYHLVPTMGYAIPIEHDHAPMGRRSRKNVRRPPPLYQLNARGKKRVPKLLRAENEKANFSDFRERFVHDNTPMPDVPPDGAPFPFIHSEAQEPGWLRQIRDAQRRIVDRKGPKPMGEFFDFYERFVAHAKPMPGPEDGERQRAPSAPRERPPLRERPPARPDAKVNSQPLGLRRPPPRKTRPKAQRSSPPRATAPPRASSAPTRRPISPPQSMELGQWLRAWSGMERWQQSRTEPFAAHSQLFSVPLQAPRLTIEVLSESEVHVRVWIA